MKRISTVWSGVRLQEGIVACCVVNAARISKTNEMRGLDVA